MTLHYHWENMKVNVATDGVHNLLEPHTHEEIRDVDYDFEVEIKETDIVSYLTPRFMKQEELPVAKFYMKKMFRFIQENLTLDLEELEKDTEFVEYMKEQYETNALDEWQEYYNEAY